jgi:hypothetical protein
MDTHSIAPRAPAHNPSARPRDARWLLVSLLDLPHYLIAATFVSWRTAVLCSAPRRGGS